MYAGKQRLLLCVLCGRNHNSLQNFLFFFTHISLVALHTLIQKPVRYSELPDRMSVIKLFLARKKILFPVAESSGCSLFPVAEFPRISDNFQTYSPSHVEEFSRISENYNIGLCSFPVVKFTKNLGTFWEFPRKKNCQHQEANHRHSDCIVHLNNFINPPVVEFEILSRHWKAK